MSDLRQRAKAYTQADVLAIARRAQRDLVRKLTNAEVLALALFNQTIAQPEPEEN